MGSVVGTFCLARCCEPCCGYCGCCGSKDIPLHVSELTPHLITSLLHSGGTLDDTSIVTSVNSSAFIHDGGIGRAIYRLELEYDPPNSGPQRIICKMTPSETETRILGEILKMYESEVNYYNYNMISTTGMEGPKLYFAKHGGYGRFILLQEDLAPAKTTKINDGASFAQAHIAIKNVARLHAMYRGKVSTSPTTKDWVLRADDLKYWSLVENALRKSVAMLNEARYREFRIEQKEIPHFHGAALYLSNNWKPYQDYITENLKRKNPNAMFTHTLRHGDYHLENMFFDVPGMHGPTFKCVDYQLVREDNGAVDVCYFIVRNLTCDLRRKFEKQLIMLYYKEMHSNGATDLTMTELLLSYQLGIFCPVLMFAVGQKYAKDDSKTNIKCAVERIDKAVLDWGCLDALDMFSSKSFNGMTVLSKDEIRQIIPHMYHEYLDLDDRKSIR